MSFNFRNETFKMSVSSNPSNMVGLETHTYLFANDVLIKLISIVKPKYKPNTFLIAPFS